MDFDFKIKMLEEKIASNLTELKLIKKQLADAKKFTSKFLDECVKSGIKKVGISKTIPEVDWPFETGNGSVFGIGRDKTGWPAIWGVAERMGISYGGGNTGQHQANTSRLIDGIFELKKGKWIKIEDKKNEK